MEALAPPEDDVLTLQEALAFIDACEGAAPASALAASPSGSDATTSASAESDDGERLRDQQRRKKALNALAVRRCQRRKKQELRELREQVAELERTLAGLQADRKAGDGAGYVDVAGRQSVWAFMAARERTERDRSEAQNQQLRATLNKYLHMASALHGMASAEAMDLELQAILYARPAPLYAPPPKVFSIDYALAELELSMKKMYIDTGTVLDSIKIEVDDFDPGQVFVGAIPGQGEFVELKRAHEIPVSRKAAAAAIWQGMITFEGCNQYHIKTRVTKETSGHKNFELAIKDSSQRVKLNGVSFLQRFEETHRSLFAYTTLVTIPSHPGLRFREKSWMQITGNSPEQSVLRTCYHMYAESPALAKPAVLDNPRERELREVQNFVLRAIANRACSDSLRFQQALCTVGR